MSKLVHILYVYDSISCKETSPSEYQTNVTKANPCEVSRNCSCSGPLRTAPSFLHMKNFAETTTKKFWDLVINICRTISTSVLCIHSEGSLDVQPMMQLALFQLKQHDLFSFAVLPGFHTFRGNVQSGMWDHTYWQISPPGKWKYYSHRTLQLFSIWLNLRGELIPSVILLSYTGTNVVSENYIHKYGKLQSCCFCILNLDPKLSSQ